MFWERIVCAVKADGEKVQRGAYCKKAICIQVGSCKRCNVFYITKRLFVLQKWVVASVQLGEYCKKVVYVTEEGSCKRCNGVNIAKRLFVLQKWVIAKA